MLYNYGIRRSLRFGYYPLIQPPERQAAGTADGAEPAVGPVPPLKPAADQPEAEFMDDKEFRETSAALPDKMRSNPLFTGLLALLRGFSEGDFAGERNRRGCLRTCGTGRRYQMSAFKSQSGSNWKAAANLSASFSPDRFSAAFSAAAFSPVS